MASNTEWVKMKVINKNLFSESKCWVDENSTDLQNIIKFSHILSCLTLDTSVNHSDILDGLQNQGKYYLPKAWVHGLKWEKWQSAGTTNNKCWIETCVWLSVLPKSKTSVFLA